MTRTARMVAVAASLLAMFGGVASAADSTGTETGLITTSIAAETPEPPALDATKATTIARTSQRLQRWLRDHPTTRTSASIDDETKVWTVAFIDAKNETQAQVLVDDGTSVVTETRTGPQVAWQMARGYKGAFGRSVTKPQIWIPLFVLFLLPLIRWRRIVSWHTLDLLMLCAFGLSLVWFNRGEIFTSVPLAYPPLAYLAVRLTAIGLRGRRAARVSPDAEPARAAAGPTLRSAFPTWLLVTCMLLAVGLRIGLNAFDANVIDVGYAGVIGADRIAHGQTPYGTFPSDCGQCDTYGPVTYLAYVPFEAIAPWTGTWDSLDAAHGAAVVFDLATLLGLLLLGWRLGGQRVAAGLGLAWTAFPFSAYALESNSNDALVAACLVWGLLLAHRPVGKGVAVGLAVLAKFTPAILLLLWSRHPFPRSSRTHRLLPYLAGLAVATAASGWVVALDGADGIRRFWSRTLGFQLDRESPFSIWGQYPALRPLQLGLAGVVIVVAIVVAVRPRRLDLRSFAALSAALLVGIQLTMTHWFYLYIPWFLPLALVALVPAWPAPAPDPEPSAAVDGEGPQIAGPALAAT